MQIEQAMTLSTFSQIQWQRSENHVPYEVSLAEMEARVAAIHAGTASESVWLLEHPPLFTAGTSARDSDLFNPRNLPTYRAGRGGQWTYHGPGQMVGYVMLDLTRPHGDVPPRDLRAYVCALESWLIAIVGRFGIRGERREGRIGVWVTGADGRESKIAALGVRITRWVSWHGVALNVAPDIADYDGIVPCGIREFGVTSLADQGVTASMDEVAIVMRECWDEIFGPSA